MTSKITQRQQILTFLKRGWCTGLDALYFANTMKLASRISELRRDGYIIIDRWIEQDGKRFKSYRMSSTLRTPIRSSSACKATKKA